jgi:hypothetical protein
MKQTLDYQHRSSTGTLETQHRHDITGTTAPEHTLETNA